jgi:hypothetical protein
VSNLFQVLSSVTNTGTKNCATNLATYYLGEKEEPYFSSASGVVSHPRRLNLLFTCWIIGCCADWMFDTSVSVGIPHVGILCPFAKPVADDDVRLD